MTVSITTNVNLQIIIIFVMIAKILGIVQYDMFHARLAMISNVTTDLKNEE